MEAIKLARQHRRDLILMDIQLPGISGVEVTKWIRQDDELKAIPIIADGLRAAGRRGQVPRCGLRWFHCQADLWAQLSEDRRAVLGLCGLVRLMRPMRRYLWP
ncbi:MAG: response regulator [Dongiaceae bacterium]